MNIGEQTRKSALRLLLMLAWSGSAIHVLAPTGAAGQITFSEARPVETSALHDVVVTDLDNDGDPDLVAITAHGKDARALVWLANDGTGQFTSAQTLLRALPSWTRTLKAADLDGDGDSDLLIGNDDLFYPGGLFWTANEGGRLSALQVIEPVNSGVFVVVDFDGDGDLDVLQGGLYVGLYENTGEGGEGRFRRAHALAPGPARALVAGDFDGDGDADLVASQLSFEERNDMLFPFEQHGPGPLRMLLEREMMSFPRFQGVHQRLISVMETADINHDGQRDVIVGAFLNSDIGPDEGRLAWYENRSFGRAPLFLRNGLYGGSIASEHGESGRWGPAVLAVADFDGDGSVDVATSKAAHGTDALVWYAHPGEAIGPDATWREHAVGGSTGIIKTIQAADLNLDGDIDLVALETISGGARITWYENQGPTGTATEEPIDDAYLNQESLTLEAVWPNPSSGVVTVAYRVRQAGRVRLEIVDVMGRIVATREEQPQRPGRHQVRLDLALLAAGTYLLRIQVKGNNIVTRRMVLQ